MICNNRNGFLITQEKKKIWEVELKLVEKVFEVCKKYDLPIVSSSGTTIGAVRENGFIPWDDDIDLEMLRPDYDKLVSVASKEFQSPFFFQCAYTDKNYIRGHAQVRMDGTTAILRPDVFCDFHQGIFIDIFVFDAVPVSEREIKLLRKKTERLKHKMKLIAYRNVFLHSLNPLYKILGALSFLLYRQDDDKKIFKEFEETFRKQWNNNTTEVSLMAYSWDAFERNRRPKSFIKNIKFFPFENMMMPVPEQYHEILTRVYGDYMTPHQCPTGHGMFSVLSADHPYTDDLPKLRRNYFLKKIIEISKTFIGK